MKISKYHILSLLASTCLACDHFNDSNSCKDNNCLWHDGRCSPLNPGTTEAVSPIDAILAPSCGECSNNGQSCTIDKECEGVCDSNSDHPGIPCRSSQICRSNTDNRANGGTCLMTATCNPVPCPTPAQVASSSVTPTPGTSHVAPSTVDSQPHVTPALARGEKAARGSRRKLQRRVLSANKCSRNPAYCAYNVGNGGVGNGPRTEPTLSPVRYAMPISAEPTISPVRYAMPITTEPTISPVRYAMPITSAPIPEPVAVPTDPLPSPVPSATPSEMSNAPSGPLPSRVPSATPSEMSDAPSEEASVSPTPSPSITPSTKPSRLSSASPTLSLVPTETDDPCIGFEAFCGVNGFCVAMEGDMIPMCLCNSGYRMNEATRVCEDIDECMETPTLCGTSDKCVDLDGSYVCLTSAPSLSISPSNSPSVHPSVVPSTVPSGVPTSAPVVPPTSAPVVPPTPAPVIPPTAVPVASPTSGPIVGSTPAPVTPPGTLAPVPPPTSGPIVASTPAPVTPPGTLAPVPPPTSGPIVASTPAPVTPLTPAPVVTDLPLSTTSGVPLPVTGGETVSLLQSAAGVLYTLSSTDGKPAGRSYDGNTWERLHPMLLSYSCSGSACSVTLPAGDFMLEAFSPDVLSTSQEVSRLLMQTTFGPTESDISSMGSNPAQWIASQMALPASLHRAHYRERANARLTQGVNLFGTRNPCSPGSRWNRYAFSMEDMGSIVTVEITQENNVALQINGVTRTELELTRSDLENSLSGVVEPYVICEVAEYVGGRVLIGTEDGTGDMKCEEISAATILNPVIAFYGDAPFFVNAVLEELATTALDTKLAARFPAGCTFEPVTGPIFVQDSDSSFYVHDKRLVSIDNTPGSNSITRSDVTRTCPSAPKTFLNQDSCEIRPECSPPSWSSASLLLNEETLREFYTSAGLYVYRVGDLRFDDAQTSPCAGGMYRWTRRNSANDVSGCPGGDTSLDADIRSALINDITKGLETKTGALALDVSHDTTCIDPSNTAIGAQLSVPVPGTVPETLSCWTHSHQDEWSVYDMSAWVMLHPGNPVAFLERESNPIARIAWQDSVTLNFPDWHPKERWGSNKGTFTKVGNWYDTVDFAELDPKVQSPTMAALLGSATTGFTQQFEVCGSPGEVSNDPSKGHQYPNYRYANHGDVTEATLDQDHRFTLSKSMVWTTLALQSPDQLRQRVAWALSQIFVVSADQINIEQATEPWAAYHDIFGRHAFGNFADILKEVSMSPLMGLMLTYQGSKSLAYSVENTLSKSFPDENFAREIMQLFTIGLWKLNIDGTKLLDGTGNPLPTYDNTDITTFARGWTGLERPASRPNLEADWAVHDYSNNYIDPMRVLTKDTRDVFPKLGLDDNGRAYMGDGVQRCDQMPPKAFLKKGATYRFLGHDSSSDLGRADPSWWSGAEGWNPRLVLSPTTSSPSLYAALCNAEANGNCQFDSYVILDVNLPCDGTCNAGPYGPDNTKCECDIDEPRVVRLDASSSTGSSNPTYFEYVRQPCVNMAFPEGATYAVSEIHSGGGALCMEDTSVVASGACCDDAGTPTSRCVFQGERVSFDTANQRCLAAGQTTCAWDSVPVSSHCGTNLTPYDGTNPKAGLHFTWTNEACSVQAQVDEQGNVAIVHKVSTKPVKARVEVDTGTYFRVLWNGSYPTAASSCGSCQTVGSTCLCDTVVTTTPVFSGIPSIQAVESSLHVGASDPTSFDSGTYHQCLAPSCVASQGSILAHTKGAGPITDDASIQFDQYTIFEVLSQVSGTSRFFMNAESVVDVGGYAFRNPPMHGSIADQAPRDALYEIDQMIYMYARHSNVAPFIASRLIQLLTVSNPSPRYVEEVARAFLLGEYTADGVKFGAGNYGDMKAAIAAVFLDRDARSTLLDSDATHGRAREPILKVMHLLRSMELSSSDAREVRLATLRNNIGQEPHNAPSVFSFFLSEFSPVGPVYNAGLTSPETQLLDAPKIVGFFNALAALPLYGLSDCVWSRGLGDKNERYVVTDHPEEGWFECDSNNDLESGISVPFRLDWTPKAWSSGLPSVDAPSSVPVSFDSGPYCGCQECTQESWDTYAASSPTNNHTCGDRINWVNNAASLPNGAGACSYLAGLEGEFPEICGPSCDPARCDIDRTVFSDIARNVVSEMDTLLTGGRLESDNGAVIEAAYINEAARHDIPAVEAHMRALRKVQQLFSVTPEFHITNNLMAESVVREETVESLPENPAPAVGYKAIVYFYFDGAMDSFSALVPHSSCGTTDLPTQYQEVRTDVAIPLNDLHQIVDSSGAQPCSVFGLHPSLAHFQTLYNAGDAAVIANVGPLVEPITKEEYESESKGIPPALFAHNTQKQITQTVLAQDSSAGGVLGRIGDAINAQESVLQGEEVEIFDAYSISGTPLVLEGAPGVSRVADVLTGYGVAGLNPPAGHIETQIRSLNARVAKSIYGETFSAKVSSTLGRIDLLGETLKGATVNDEDCFDNLDTDIARQLKTVARVIAARDSLEAKRDVFYTAHGGYDTHSDNGPRLTELLTEVNSAFKCFTDELIAQGVWSDVTIVTASEFGRTLTSNGQGTDHGWGGNHFVFGGGVKGGKILGEFPSDLTDDGPLNIGRGRLIPTTSWEAVWHSISSWFGVSSAQMTNVLPTMGNFPAGDMISKEELFD